jgi:hypothetical protein
LNFASTRMPIVRRSGAGKLVVDGKTTYNHTGNWTADLTAYCDQADDSACLEGRKPAVERAARDLELTADRVDANFMGEANSPHPKADIVQASLLQLAGRSTILGRQKRKPGPSW